MFGQQQTAEPVIQTLNMALIMRKPQSVIHHSDQACGRQKTAAHPLESALLAAKIRDVRRPGVFAGDLLVQG